MTPPFWIMMLWSIGSVWGLIAYFKLFSQKDVKDHEKEYHKIGDDYKIVYRYEKEPDE